MSSEKITFDPIVGDELATGSLSNRQNIEMIAVMKSGRVWLFDLTNDERQEVGRLSFSASNLNLQIQSFQNYVGITQINGTLGTIISLSIPTFSKHLSRGDYCVQVSRFPIAFFRRDSSTLLIHGIDWNRLDITNLETDELLTDRVVDGETDSNYFDYFHGSLSIAPDSESFISNGWHWHPYGQLTHYSIDKFLKEFEMAHVDLNLIDNLDSEDACYELGWERPVCWIDSKTLGIPYNRGTGDNDGGKHPSEILIYDLANNEITRRIELDGFDRNMYCEVSGELYFDSLKDRFIGKSKRWGIFIATVDGKLTHKRQDLAHFSVNMSHRILYHIDYPNNLIEIERIDSLEPDF